MLPRVFVVIGAIALLTGCSTPYTRGREQAKEIFDPARAGMKQAYKLEDLIAQQRIKYGGQWGQPAPQQPPWNPYYQGYQQPYPSPYPPPVSQPPFSYQQFQEERERQQAEDVDRAEHERTMSGIRNPGPHFWGVPGLTGSY